MTKKQTIKEILLKKGVLIKLYALKRCVDNNASDKEFMKRYHEVLLSSFKSRDTKYIIKVGNIVKKLSTRRIEKELNYVNYYRTLYNKRK